MSHRREKRARRATRLAIMTAVSLEGSLVGHAVFADQEQATSQPQATSKAAAKYDELQEIVVTGSRASLQSALDSKRNSNLPMESVQPEDIGKMPDQNVAESLQRLPGVQIDRGQAGQGTSVLIDGLRQNLTTLNGDTFLTGREFYVSGEAANAGGGATSQYASLEGIPSQIVGGIDVYKNPDASMTEGGLGGTINLKTLDPLKQPDGLSLSGVMQETSGDFTNNSKTPGGTLVGSYKVSDRLAFTGSFTFDDEKTHTKEFQDENRADWTIPPGAAKPLPGPLAAAGLSALPNGKTYLDPQFGYFTDAFDYRDDKGASFGVAAKVTDHIETSLNWFFSSETDTNYSYTDKAWFNGQGAQSGTLLPGIDPTKPYSIDGNGVVQNGTFNANAADTACCKGRGAPPGSLLPGIAPPKPYSIDGNGVVQNGTFNANGAETATLYQQNKSQANNFQWLTKFNEGGALRGSFDASFSHATSNLQADQADVEHEQYLTSAGVSTAPAAPGCNNGSSTCSGGNSKHGYEFAYANGGTSGLPSVSYLAPYADILNNPNYTTFKSNWAWANLTDYKQFAVKGDIHWDPAFITDVPTTISAGVGGARCGAH